MREARQLDRGSQERLFRHMEDLAAAGKIRKGTGTIPDHIIDEPPPQLPDPQSAVLQLLEDRERGW